MRQCASLPADPGVKKKKKKTEKQLCISVSGAERNVVKQDQGDQTDQTDQSSDSHCFPEP